jgi:hypothetical protein
MKPFIAPAFAIERLRRASPSSKAPQHPSATIRRFRLPMAVRVVTDHGAPVRIVLSALRLAPAGLAQGKEITHRAGPWRTSGQWWTADRDTWDRDEWDVSVETGVVYRLARDRATDRWEVEGVID